MNLAALRVVEVPEKAKAVLVSDQLLARFADWTRVSDEGRMVEARVVPTNDPNVVDVELRYVAPDNRAHD